MSGTGCLAGTAGREDMNTALKLRETASFQGSNTQDKDNLQTVSRDLVPFLSGIGAIQKKKRNKPSKEIFTYWDDITRRPLKQGDFDLTTIPASTLGKQFEKFLATLRLIL